MTADPLTVAPDTLLQDALRLLAERPSEISVLRWSIPRMGAAWVWSACWISARPASPEAVSLWRTLQRAGVGFSPHQLGAKSVVLS